jgi:hypothetical protein
MSYFNFILHWLAPMLLSPIKNIPQALIFISEHLAMFFTTLLMRYISICVMMMIAHQNHALGFLDFFLITII